MRIKKKRLFFKAIYKLPHKFNPLQVAHQKERQMWENARDPIMRSGGRGLFFDHHIYNWLQSYGFWVICMDHQPRRIQVFRHHLSEALSHNTAGLLGCYDGYRLLAWKTVDGGAKS
jgi:hypothetical protein